MQNRAAAFAKAADFFFSCSPLYQTLSRHVAQDPYMLDMVRDVRNTEQSTYLFFAAVLHALSHRPDHPLARFYAVLTPGIPRAPDEAYSPFRDFIHSHRDEIVSSITTRPLNRSIPRRSLCLAPLVQTCATIDGSRKVTLVDVGCGAGFNLLPDQYERAFTTTDERLDNNPGRLTAISRGTLRPPDGLPEIGTRIGIDLDLPDLRTDDDRRWILSQLIADDRQAHSVATAMLVSPELKKLDLRKGDAVEDIEALLMSIEADDPIIIMHSVFIHYLNADQRQHFLASIARCAGQRRIKRVAMEIAGHGTSLTVFDGAGAPAACGRSEIDGTWIQWTRL